MIENNNLEYLLDLIAKIDDSSVKSDIEQTICYRFKIPHIPGKNLMDYIPTKILEKNGIFTEYSCPELIAFQLQEILTLYPHIPFGEDDDRTIIDMADPRWEEHLPEEDDGYHQNLRKNSFAALEEYIGSDDEDNTSVLGEVV